ncbi:hypothetical protein FACS1894139_06390 [Planctomycetales bacterium]|nr:hypothetical protein FACS1894107_08180 [Planctomycetales bacterium]GHS96084.1 hypothetical protein FACS1894108_00050 [Planctomycetales bacterium]GHT04361.1 hypothetical protein FACS1894139_06390 [Planctomycetales bacterium]
MTEQPNPTTTTAEAVVLSIEDSAHSAWRRVSPYSTHLLIVAVFAVIFASLYGLVNHWQTAAETRAWQQIFAADFAARQTPNQAATALSKIMPEIATAHARFYAYMLEQSRLSAGDDRGDWELAATAAQNFLDQFPRSPWAAQVRFDYAGILANLGKYAEAAGAYLTVAQTRDRFRDEALWFAALCNERAGKTNEALDGYARIAGDAQNGYAALANFARLRLEQKPINN